VIEDAGSGHAATGPLGILGGTFDPVHLGHLRAALEVLDSCRLAGMRLIPAGQPPHRAPPVAPAELRIRMLRAAAAAEPRLTVDERETQRQGPSYTVDTLTALRHEVGDRPLCLVVGADAFLGLASWHRWRELPGLAHLIVIHRPGWTLSAEGEVARLLTERRSEDVRALHRLPSGVVRIQPVTALEISSSAIRALVAAGGDPRFLVPDVVRDLVMTSGCYKKPANAVAGSMEV
jgi:nicotinate-nucleotide adenylyltransferase